MKTILFTIMFVFIFSLVNTKAFAETSVNIQNNGSGASSDVQIENSSGQNTICVNGHCSTTNNGNNGNNSATVCINGNCTTSPDGNVDRQDDGARVRIQNQNNNNGSETNSPMPVASETPFPTDIPTTSPSIRQKNAPNQQLQSQQSGIEQMLNNLKQFFSSFVHQGK